MPLPLGTPGAGQPTTGVTVGDAVGSNTGIGFGLHEPAKMRKALSKATLTSSDEDRETGSPSISVSDMSQDNQSSNGGSGSGSTGSSVSAISKVMDAGLVPSSTHLASSSSTSSNSSARGTLSVKLISARGLAVSHAADASPEPYVVIQFEQNEFISRPPRPATSASSVPFTTATAQPLTPGNLTRSTSGLAVSTITRAFAEAVGRGKTKKDIDGSGAQTPKGEEPAGGMSWMGKPGPGDPVWKEEVAL